jgi:hypothetical protein
VPPPHRLAVLQVPSLHAPGVHPSTALHSPFVTHWTHEVPLQYGVPPPHWLVVLQVPLLHDAGVHPSGAWHWELEVHATHPPAVQLGVAPLHAAPPLQVQAPALHVFVSPVHCELEVQLTQPVDSQVWPVPQASLPLQVHAPFVHVFVAPMQSLDVQQPVEATQVPSLHIRPEQEHPPVALHVWPAAQAVFPLQVHVPMVHVSVAPVQSASVQHPDSEMHVLMPQALKPVGH